VLNHAINAEFIAQTLKAVLLVKSIIVRAAQEKFPTNVNVTQLFQNPQKILNRLSVFFNIINLQKNNEHIRKVSGGMHTHRMQKG
jgi:hypothetical protein